MHTIVHFTQQHIKWCPWCIANVKRLGFTWKTTPDDGRYDKLEVNLDVQHVQQVKFVGVVSAGFPWSF